MFRTVLYLCLIVALGGVSAWLGQEWRYEGAVEESKQASAGKVAYEKKKIAAEQEARTRIQQAEGKAKAAAADLVQSADASAKGREIQGERERVGMKQTAELATAHYYLSPRIAPFQTAAKLKEALKDEAVVVRAQGAETEKFEVLVEAIRIMTRVSEDTASVIDDVRIKQSTDALSDYSLRRARANCH